MTETTNEDDYKFINSGFYTEYPIITHEQFLSGMKFVMGKRWYYRWRVRWFFINIFVALGLMKKPFTLGDIE